MGAFPNKSHGDTEKKPFKTSSSLGAKLSLSIRNSVYVFPLSLQWSQLASWPPASQRGNAFMISSPKPLTDIPLRSAYTDLNFTSTVSSHEPQNESIQYKESRGSIWTSHMWWIMGGWQLAAFSSLYKHTRAEITPGLFRKRCLRAERGKEQHPSSVWKEESSAGALGLGQGKQENKRCYQKRTPVKLQFIEMHHYSL